MKYKGYLLLEQSYSSEKTYYDGHRNEGTGEYETVRYISAVKIRSGKSSSFSSIQEAKKWIDKQANPKLRKSKSSLQKKLKVLEQKQNKLLTQEKQLLTKLRHLE